MTRYFYDCEFLEDGRTIELISIGIAAEDGRELYLVNYDAPWDRILGHEWLMTNVVPYLPVRLNGHTLVPEKDNLQMPTKPIIAQRVQRFLTERGPAELWANWGAYDHVALCQLWGRMIDLPSGIPMFTHDLQQEHARLGHVPLPAQELSEHHALADAKYLRLCWQLLSDYDAALAVTR